MRFHSTTRLCILVVAMLLAGVAADAAETTDTIHLKGFLLPPKKKKEDLDSTPTLVRTDFARKILAGARKEVANGVIYDDSQRSYRMPYPNGDVPSYKGVCTDLIIRAFRNAGIDLQKEIYEDSMKNPKGYPCRYKGHKTNPDLDHRRCRNQVVFLRRHALELTKHITPQTIDEWQAGDVVYFAKDGQDYPWHVGIVSDKRDGWGFPKIVHLFPPSACEESIRKYLPIHSHFRWVETAKK
jgi:uncharacterized protein YijF (DUF1287 family)